MSRPHCVLVPFELPDHEPVPSALVEEIAAMEVVVLGHFRLPEQTPPAAGREQFGDGAQAELDRIAEDFAGGASVTTRLVFGKDRAKTIDRVALAEDCDVVLTGGETATGGPDRVLVPLRGEDNLAGILAFVAELQAATDASLTLYHATDESDRLPGESLLDDAVAELERDGVDPERVERRLSDGDAMTEIVELGHEFDVIVLGETAPSLRERLFDEAPARITAATERPVFVVRQVD
jgi:nucleotide-binding universal stress UspA family protein